MKASAERGLISAELDCRNETIELTYITNEGSNDNLNDEHVRPEVVPVDSYNEPTWLRYDDHNETIEDFLKKVEHQAGHIKIVMEQTGRNVKASTTDEAASSKSLSSIITLFSSSFCRSIKYLV
ncbi:hypothetical protein SAMD00023353_0202190 [Rosellinia necatrix]|uniref:Uncharacterized protein n=1 Tax=Rosellinia necatrix TaxID=77044 RepID=A0A1S7UK54_ROSNE|nr:hypothetical protein SAMD00023353_0202190 [Rosellinia necatrix]